jgi:hypothetical protein
MAIDDGFQLDVAVRGRTDGRSSRPDVDFASTRRWPSSRAPGQPSPILASPAPDRSNSFRGKHTRSGGNFDYHMHFMLHFHDFII